MTLTDTAPTAQTHYRLAASDRDVFRQEFKDLIEFKRQGHLIHRCYMTSHALFLGGKFSNTNDNYTQRDERLLIANTAELVAQDAAHKNGIIGIDNGIGMQMAMLKSAMFWRAMPNLHTLVGRELAPTSIDIMSAVMGAELPNVRIVPDCADFILDPLPSGLGEGRKIMTEFGLTSGNMEGFEKDGFPVQETADGLAARIAHLDEGDIMTFTFDANQNRKQVEAMYNNEWTQKWAREFLRFSIAELDIKEGDLSPEGFHFRSIWSPHSHCGHNYLIADRSMNFEFDGQACKVDKGDAWGITNSYKMPTEIARDIAQNQLGKNAHIHQRAGNRIAMAELHI